MRLSNKKYNQFITEVNELIDENKNINFNLDDIKEAVVESREEVYNKLIAENDNLNDNRKLHHISDNDKLQEYETLNSYAELSKKESKKCCKCECMYFNCCCCCCCRKAKKLESDICYMMSNIKEKLIPFKRKYDMITSLKEEFKKFDIDKNKFKIFNRYLCYIIIVIPLIITFEFPLFYYDIKNINDNENDRSKNQFEFILALIMFLFLILFYFIIHCYGVLENRHIHGETLFGKNESSSEGVNFFNFTNSIGFFDQIIYHAGWVLNKKGEIKARFNEIYVLPDYQINDDLNLMRILPYISIGLIVVFLIISSKFSKFSICGNIIFNFNESCGFFDDNEKFYGYFFIGCGCYIDVYRRNNNLQPLIKELSTLN